MRSFWSARQDSNLRSPAPKAGGLDRTFLRAAGETGRRSWDRTSDIPLIERVLYQLSYATNTMVPAGRRKPLDANACRLFTSPGHHPPARLRSFFASCRALRDADVVIFLVRPEGFEPSTPEVEARCSGPLS